jgi:hypothetical protein
MKHKQIYIAACLLGLLATSNANADVIPYPNAGTENPTVYSFTASNTGTIGAYFDGSTAGYESTISMLVNGVVTSETSAGVLNNHTSAIGQFFNLGSVTAGDSIVFRLNVLTTGEAWYSNKALNSDGINHVYSTTFSGDAINNIPTGTYVAFEDVKGGGDLNYYDGNFVFTTTSNTSAVPEPETAAMLLAGMSLIGFSARRRNSNQS